MQDKQSGNDAESLFVLMTNGKNREKKSFQLTGKCKSCSGKRKFSEYNMTSDR